MIFEIWYCLKAISHYWMGLVEQVYFGGRLLIRLRVSEGERERERLFGCLKVLLKVYRLRCFKKTEILSGGCECEFYTYTPTLLYTWKEDSKKEKKAMLLL